jgi:hypothetical protein
VIGVGLAVQGLRRGAGAIATVALGVNGIFLLLMVGARSSTGSCTCEREHA